MAHPIVRLLSIHGFSFDQVQVIGINDNGSFDFIGPDHLQYRISAEAITCLAPVEIPGVELIPEITTKIEIKRPRGWSLKAVYVDPDGTVFHKGVEQPELKGTIAS